MSGAKKRKGSEILFWIAIILLLCVMGFSLYKIWTIAGSYMQGRHIYTTIAKEAGAEKDAKAEKDDVEINFKKLQKKYPDVKAWLYSKGTMINYPVAQGKGDDWYLHHTLDGKWNGAGTLFIDQNNDRPFEDFLTIIYGHHMRDGSMFGSLVKYRDEEYYKKHKKLRLYTPEQKYDLVVIGVCTIPAISDMYRYDLEDDAAKEAYISLIEQISETACDDHASAADRIVMLSTCTYEFNDARLVVFGKLA